MWDENRCILMRQKLETLTGERRGKSRNEQKLTLRLKEAKNKDVFSRQSLTYRWSHLDQIWGKGSFNAFEMTPISENCSYSWKQGDISLLIGWDGDDITSERGHYYSCLVSRRNRGRVKLKAVWVHFIISVSAECQKRRNLSADPPEKNHQFSTFFGDFFDSNKWSELVERFTSLYVGCVN